MALAGFVVFAIIGQFINIMICLAIDQMFSPMAGALTFVALYMLVFAGAWMLALLVFDREPKRASANRMATSHSTRGIPAH
jgi:Flp pilus assembly protein protease CpaA